jgi:hypothetical protein
MTEFMIFIFGIFGCSQQLADQNLFDKNFALIDDFEQNREKFTQDKYDLMDYSTDGGELISYHAKEKDYLVFDVWLFGETGKTHSTYWTDKKFNFKIIRTTRFDYDKPYYEGDYKVTETLHFLSYAGTSVKLYNSEKKEWDPALAPEMKDRKEELFRDLVKDLKLKK